MPHKVQVQMLDDVDASGLTSGDFIQFNGSKFVRYASSLLVPASLLTTKGDLLTRTSSAVARQGVGSDGQLLTADSAQPNGIKWATPTAGMTNPMTTAADLIVGGTSGTPTRLAKGSDGQVLTVDPTTHLLIWATPSAGFSDPTTTKGDLIVHGTSTTRLGVGSDTQVLIADSTQTLGVKWGSVSVAGGASTADHFIVGMGGEGDTDLSNKIVIPGLSGSPDIRVAGTNDDEFDQNASGTPSGWTDISSGAADTIDTNTYKSHLHLKANAAGGTAWKGIYKTAPSMPFTMIAKFADVASKSNFNYEAMGVGESGSTGKFTICGVQTNNNGLRTACVTDYTNRTTVSAGIFSGTAESGRPPVYFKMIVTSSTSISYWYSVGGMIWNPLAAARNPGFTVAIVCLMVNAESGTDPAELYVDWVRFS